MSQVISSFHFFDIFTSLNIFTSFTIFSSLTLSLLEAIAHDVSPVAMFKINWPFWAIFCFCKICLNFTIDLIPPQETFNFSEVDFVFKIKMGLSYTILKCDRPGHNFRFACSNYRIYRALRAWVKINHFLSLYFWCDIIRAADFRRRRLSLDWIWPDFPQFDPAISFADTHSNIQGKQQIKALRLRK